MKKNLYRRYLINLQSFLARPAQPPKQTRAAAQTDPA